MTTIIARDEVELELFWIDRLRRVIARPLAPLSALLMVLGCAESSDRVCIYKDAKNYIEDGKAVLEQFVKESAAEKHALSDGYIELPPREMEQISSDRFEFQWANAEGSAELLGFTLIYTYTGSNVWDFFVNYDHHCRTRIAYGLHTPRLR
jgi:hypothetical protein